MARFQIRSNETQKTESNNWDSVTLMNLSARDTFFYYKKDLEIGTLLDLKIDVSKSTPTINCVGKKSALNNRNLILSSVSQQSLQGLTNKKKK